MEDVFINACSALAGATIGTFTTFYFRKRAEISAISDALKTVVENTLTTSKATEEGKIDAVTDKLEQVIKQNKAMTQATEVIKSDIESVSWRNKEKESLKRQKLEEYTLLVLVSTDNFTAKVMDRLYGQESVYDDNIIKKASVIQSLYLPELLGSHVDLLKASASSSRWFSEALTAKLDDEHVEYSRLNSLFSDELHKLNDAVRTAIEGASNLAESLNHI